MDTLSYFDADSATKRTLHAVTSGARNAGRHKLLVKGLIIDKLSYFGADSATKRTLPPVMTGARNAGKHIFGRRGAR
jgi:hypothetical protein